MRGAGRINNAQQKLVGAFWFEKISARKDSGLASWLETGNQQKTAAAGALWQLRAEAGKKTGSDQRHDSAVQWHFKMSGSSVKFTTEAGVGLKKRWCQ